MHDFLLWREEMRTVQGVSAFRTVTRNLLVGDAAAEPVQVAEMTASGFRVAGVPPLLGRPLVEGDGAPDAPPVLVLGYDAWRTRFAADPRVIGREVRLGRTVYTVVGVMPEGFAFPLNHSFWTPLRLEPARWERGQGPELFVFGRLAPGATAEAAQAELAAIGARTAASFPETHARLEPRIHPYTYPLIDIQGIGLWEIAQMQGMLSLLLVVVAANVAVLVYARTAMRRGEIAVRTALGASRRRIVAQLFVESLVLSVLAAAVGLGVAQYGFRKASELMEMEGGASAFWVDYGLSPATALYALGLAVLVAAAVGVVPALQATGRRVQGSLRELSGGTGMRLGRTWTALIVGQVALAVAALPAALGLGWGEIRAGTTHTAFAAEQYLALRVAREPDPDAPAGTDAPGPSPELAALQAELTRRLRADPGVAEVSFSEDIPGQESLARVEVEGGAVVTGAQGHRATTGRVAPELFGVLDVPVLAGRALAAADADTAARAVVVNRSFVRQVLGGGEALGRRIRYHPEADDDAPRGAEAPPTTPWYEVVGVVEDLEANPFDETLVYPGVYHALAPGGAEPLTLAVRVRGDDAEGAALRVRGIATALAPTLRVVALPMDALERQMQMAVRLMALVLGMVLVSVLLLSAAGIYAMMSFTVTRRRREIGIRAALGAHPRRILASVFARAAGQLGAGLVLGVAAAAGLDRLSGGGMMGGEGAVILPSVAALMLATGLLAAAGPARRGLRVQPMEALRSE